MRRMIVRLLPVEIERARAICRRMGLTQRQMLLAAMDALEAREIRGPRRGRSLP